MSLSKELVLQKLPAQLKALYDLLEAKGIDLADLEQAKVERVKLYQGMSKDADGEAHLTDMAAIQFSPAWEQDPEWPVVAQAKPCVIRPVAKGSAPKGDWHTAVILPDCQIGYRKFLDTDELDPFHDEAAMSVALKLIRHLRPEVIVNLGDFCDFPEFGKYEQEPEFAQTTQQSIDRAHRFLAEQRAAAPDADIRLIEGNHDARLGKAIARNAMSALRLKRADAPESWPVLSVPFLLRLDDLGVTYVPGYPAGLTWINDNVACIHGWKVRSSASTAAAVIDDERVTTIFGHIHRIEAQSKTRRTKLGAKHAFAYSPGCLCRIDGAVPSVKSATDPMGRPVPTVENWTQGLGVVTYEPGDGRFAYEQAAIYDGEMSFRGVRYAA
jgi:predicted phosphodiesterase